MTSSLVGSEMCIRDRELTVSLSKSRIWRSKMNVAPVRVNGQFVPGSSSSVSYTHLTLPTICSV
eukprot:6563989-Prorocentrum_lima.AAC.1